MALDSLALHTDELEAGVGGGIGGRMAVFYSNGLFY
jgi:hypothetical protein